MDKIKTTRINDQDYIPVKELEKLFRQMEAEKNSADMESSVEEMDISSEVQELVKQIREYKLTTPIIAYGTRPLPGDIIDLLRGGDNY